MADSPRSASAEPKGGPTMKPSEHEAAYKQERRQRTRAITLDILDSVRAFGTRGGFLVWESWPSVAELAAHTGRPHGTVSNHVRQAYKAELVKRCARSDLPWCPYGYRLTELGRAMVMKAGSANTLYPPAPQPQEACDATTA
ncbi:MAG: winged helix-turn-helix transcriptional regulator [bacterium]|nr:winged helix-turn-helix transcriptional regulator [bacterium]